MVDYSINAVPRRKVYTGSAGVGPYAFTFEILKETDIAVYKNSTQLALSTEYTVTINANGTGSVTLVTAANSNDRIIITGARAIERTTDFTTGGDLTAATLNEQLDANVIFSQQVAESLRRAIKAPVYDPEDAISGGTLDMELPDAATRANKVLSFDADGNPSATAGYATEAYVDNAVAGVVSAAGNVPAPTAPQTGNLLRATGAGTYAWNTPLSAFIATLLDDVDATAARATLGITSTAPIIAWTDVASAATTDIGAVDSDNLRVTGVTTITSLGTSASGKMRRLRFASALTLTHNATSLILPGGANITTAANDTCTAVSLGSGNWIIVGYHKASGKPNALLGISDLSATGSPSSSTYLRGDNSWATISNGLTGAIDGLTTSGANVGINTNNAGGVGAYALLTCPSGSIASGTTIAGSSMRYTTMNNTPGIGSGATPLGTWRNVSGNTVNTADAGLFIRTV